MAKSLVALLLYCTQFYFVYSIGPRYEIYKDPDYKYLPPIYRMEDFRECTKRQDTYCEIQIELSKKGPSPVWHIMEETMADTRTYLPRNKLRRALCLPKNMVKNKENLSEIILNRIEYEISPINLTGKVNKIDCNKDIVYTLYDLVLVLVCTFYISLLLYCTLTDRKIRNKKPKSEKDTPSNIPPFIATFSFISNFEKFKKLPTNADYQRLKSFQGMRCVVMILIVVGHSVYSHMYGYVENPGLIETHIALYGYQMFANMGMLQVQIFLLMSGFLLGLQVLTINDLLKGFKFKQVILLNINRYLRLLPVVGSIIAIHTSAIPLLVLKNAPMASKLTERTENCKKNWWKTVLFIHNNEAAHKMCESGTWYIGVDSQMYAVSLIFLYFIMKFKLGFKALAQIAAALTVFYASLILYYNMDFFCRLTPERLQFGQLELSFEFTLLYISTYSSASTFIIGIMFGWFYYQNKSLTVNTKLLFIPWFLLFFVLPWFILHVTIEDYSGSLKPFYGAIIKPVFAFGVGMGLLGMSYGIGGPIKKIFEWKYFEYFAKITFSMYIFHFDIVFPRSLFMYTPLYLTVGMLIKNHIIDLILSIILGFIMYMIIELPFSNFFKLLLKGVIEKENQKIKKEE